MPTTHLMLASLRMRVCGDLPEAMVGPIEEEPDMTSFRIALPNGFLLDVCADSMVAHALFAVIRTFGGPTRKLSFEAYYDGEIGGGKSSLTSIQVLQILRTYAELPAPGPRHGSPPSWHP